MGWEGLSDLERGYHAEESINCNDGKLEDNEFGGPPLRLRL